jgi:hypothetical protein
VNSLIRASAGYERCSEKDVNQKDGGKLKGQASSVRGRVSTVDIALRSSHSEWQGNEIADLS